MKNSHKYSLDNYAIHTTMLLQQRRNIGIANPVDSVILYRKLSAGVACVAVAIDAVVYARWLAFDWCR